MKTLTPSLRALVIPGMLFLGACCTATDVVVPTPKPAPKPVPGLPAPAPSPAPKPAPIVAPIAAPIAAPKPAPIAAPVVAPVLVPVVIPPAPAPVVVEPKKQQPPVIVAPQVIIPKFSDIYFEFDKSLIRKDAAPQLENVADWMKANPTKTIVLEAHADARGASTYNIALGQRRADAVKAYLLKQGIDPSRVKAVSYGKDKPFVTGSNEQSKNRRIHFVVE